MKMVSVLLMEMNGKRAVLLTSLSLNDKPVTLTHYAILDGKAPSPTEFRRVPVRGWTVDGGCVHIDALDGDFHGALLTTEEPIKRPRGKKTYKDGMWV